MKKLLLALLLCATAIIAAGQAPDLSAFDMCGPDVYKGTYYFQYPGGPECGLTYQYCDGRPPYHDGCTTSYYTQYYYCECE